MNLLYQVLSETIEEIIEKKRSKIRAIESDPLRAKNDKEIINDLHRQINYLYVMDYKIREILSFVQDLDNS